MVAEKKLQSKQNIQLKSTTKHNGQNKLRHPASNEKKVQISSSLAFFLSNLNFFFHFFINVFSLNSSFKIKLVKSYASSFNTGPRFNEVQSLKIRLSLEGSFGFTWFFLSFFNVDIFLELCFVSFCGLLYIKLALGCLIILILFLPLFC